jgi:hypothetical protein
MSNSKSNDNSRDDDPEEEYREDIRAAIILKEIIPDLRKKEQLEIESLIDIGVGGSGASLIYGLIDSEIKVIAGLDSEYPSIPWFEITEWEDFSGKTIKSIEANIFDEKEIEDQLIKLELGQNYMFSIGYLNKTLHHLRENDCQFQEGKKCKLKIYQEGKECKIKYGYCKLQDCEEAVGKFLPEKIFNSLFQLANTLIISEYYSIGEDDDKEDSQGGYLNIIEIQGMLDKFLNKEYFVKFYKPNAGEITENNLKILLEKLKSLDHMVFVVKSK